MNFDFTGVASNENGEFYIENGKVDFSKNGSYVYNGVRYCKWTGIQSIIIYIFKFCIFIICKY